MKKTTDIVLSASALAAAIGALSHVAQTPKDDGGAYRINVSNHEELENKQQDAIATAISHTSTQYMLRQSMSTLLPAMDVDKETLEKTWLRIASTNNNLQGSTDAIGTSRLRGPHADSSLIEEANPLTNPGIDQYGVAACYTNCHSACHGSRGWR